MHSFSVESPTASIFEIKALVEDANSHRYIGNTALRLKFHVGDLKVKSIGTPQQLYLEIPEGHSPGNGHRSRQINDCNRFILQPCPAQPTGIRIKKV